MAEFPIDAVITWVDGNDPQHKAKRMRYITAMQKQDDEVGGDIRFTSVGEIKYAVASILRFAPFVRTIYIVTDQQNPQIDDFVDKHFPNRTTSIQIVDHTVLFSGYEDVLPIFNSLSIETVLWRIPNLSEHFLYFNDDVMIVTPTTTDDYFDAEGRAICYAKPFSVAWAAILRLIKPKKNGVRVFGYKDAMLNTAQLVGERCWFPYIAHIPFAQRKSVLQQFYSEHSDAFMKNLNPRFREPHQHNPQVLCYMVGLKSGAVVMRNRTGIDLYIKPKARKGYMQRKLQGFSQSTTAKFACFNSLDYAHPSDQALAIHWLEQRLKLS